MYIILIVVIIVLSLTIYSKASKGEEDIKAGRYSDADEFFQELISEYE